MSTLFPFGWWVREDDEDLLHRTLNLPKKGEVTESVCGYMSRVSEFMATMEDDPPQAMACSECVPVAFRHRDLSRHMPSRVVVEEAIRAAAYALKKHGPPTNDAVRGVGVVTEEVGEAMEQALKLTSGNSQERGDLPWAGRVGLLREEWAQIAGYALLQIQNIDSGLIQERITDQP